MCQVCFRGSLCVLLFVLLPILSDGQALGDYQTSPSGGFFDVTVTWSDRFEWERWDGNSWETPTGAQGYPGQSSVPGTVTIQTFHDATYDVSVTIGNLVIDNNSASFSTTGNRNLTANGNISIAGGGFFGNGSMTFGGNGNLQVAGTTTVAGSFTDNNNTGTTQFNNTVTVTGSFTSTTVVNTANMNFRRGITNSGNFNGGSATFNSNNQSLAGTSNITFTDDIIINAITVTVTNSATLSIGGTTTLNGAAGGFTDSSVNGTDIFGDNVSVGAGTSFNTNASVNVGNVIFRGGIANAGTFSAGGATFNTNTPQSVSGANALLFQNDVAITNVRVNNVNTSSFTVQGTTTLTGTNAANHGFTDSDNGNVTLLTGNVSVGAGTTFTSTTVSTETNMIFRGGIANNGVFNGGGATFNVTASQFLSGATTINFANLVVVPAGITVTNSNTTGVTMTSTAAAALSGAGAWTQAANSTLNYAGSTLTITTLNASATGNTVHYTGAAQALKNPSASNYFHLTLSGSGIKSSSGNHNIDGDLTINGTAQFDVSTPANDISVAGNWTVGSTNANPFIEGSRLVTLDGSTAQTLTTVLATGETFANLRILNTLALPGVSITFDDAVTVTGVLTMSDGNVNLNSNALTLTSNAAGALVHSLASTAGWVYGGSITRAYPTTTVAAGSAAALFPLGNATEFRPFFVAATTATTANGSFTVTHNGTATNTTTVSITDASVVPTATIVRQHQAYWTIANTGITGGTFTVTAGGTGFGVIGSLNDLRLSKAGAIVNTHSTATNTTADPRANRTGVTLANLLTGTGRFYLGSTDANSSPLPIVLTYFRANVVNDVVELKWSTAQEMNNHFFTIERTTNLEAFEPILTKEGKGTTQHAQTYFDTDTRPLYGRSYYRLKQTDFDGQFTYSDVQVVVYEGPRYASLKTYPNPSDGHTLTIEIIGLKDQTSIPVQVFNIQGQKVIEQVIPVDTPGSVRYNFEFASPLQQGLYIVKAGQTLQLTQKLIVDESF